MSQEKIKEILLNLWRDSQGTSMYPNKQGNKQINQALAAINKIVMECVPEEIAVHGFYEDEEQGRIRGHNEAIAEFKANWEGK